MTTGMGTLDLYNLADSLGIRLEVGKDGLIEGGGAHDVAFAELKIPVTVEVVSSAKMDDGWAVLCRSIGNVALLLVTGYKQDASVSLFVIDVAKMKGRPESFIEKKMKSIYTTKGVVEGLAGATVGEFHKTASHEWLEAPKRAPSLDSSRKSAD